MEDITTLNESPRYETNLKQRQQKKRNNTNVRKSERVASAVGGGALAIWGIARGGAGGLGLMALGSGLLYRGVSGQCSVYKSLGINTAEPQNRQAAVQHGEGIKVESSVTINKPQQELYQYWRNFENLPRFMYHLESVQVIDSQRSRWVAKAPLGTTVEWEAEIINEKPDEMIAWRSIEGASIPNAGSVRFEKANMSGATVVRVTLSYDPPGGTLGATIAKLFGREPGQEVEADLLRFKQVMETGETASTQGQSTGKAAGRGGKR